ncbi:MAG: ACT domain-containing protein [Deltaproteobacteria bacterium]|nr:ACT domain-containing protein [Deltaproteobacteria bacterium]
MADLVRDLTSDEVDAAVVPIENSIGGWVVDILDLIHSDGYRRGGFRVVEEITIPIVISLVGHTAIERAERLYTHRYSIRCARDWLRRTRPDIPVVEVHNTAEAAAQAARDRNAVAFAHRSAALQRGIPILVDEVPVREGNATRFFVVARRAFSRRRPTKTALLFTLRDRPGALHRALGVFARERLNLTRLHSHPLDAGLNAYSFFAEIEAPSSASAMRAALERLKRYAESLEIVGSFPVVGV